MKCVAVKGWDSGPMKLMTFSVCIYICKRLHIHILELVRTSHFLSRTAVLNLWVVTPKMSNPYPPRPLENMNIYITIHGKISWSSNKNLLKFTATWTEFRGAALGRLRVTVWGWTGLLEIAKSHLKQSRYTKWLVEPGSLLFDSKSACLYDLETRWESSRNVS